MSQIKMQNHTGARTLSLSYLSFLHRRKQCLTDCFTHGHPPEFLDLVSENNGEMREESGFYRIPRKILYSVQAFLFFSHIFYLSIGVLFANSFRELLSQKIWFINKPFFKTQES